MTHVIVVAGGGISGLAAAVNSSSLGSTVTLIEESQAIAPQRSLSQLLLLPRTETPQVDPRAAAADPGELKARFGIVTKLGERALSVDTKRRVLETSLSRLRYDALVLATGASPASEAISGLTMNKKNAFVMRGLPDYSSLSRKLESFSTVAILGSSPLALAVAEIIAKRNIRVSIFSSSLLLSSYLSSSMREVVLKHLAAHGVSMIQAGFDTIAGMEKVEAVVSRGSVYPCEAAIIFPRTVPNVPRANLEKGGSGGVVVDAMMKTSEPGVFAAGDCAELRIGASSFPLRLQSAARVMGEVAGANASGRSEVAHVSGTLGLVVFGLELCSAGRTLEDAKKAGFDAREFSWSSPGLDEPFSGSETVSCSLVYDRHSHVLYGMQLAGSKALSYSDLASLSVSLSLRLEDLAHSESAYVPMISRDDESLISATAKKALSSSGR